MDRKELLSKLKPFLGKKTTFKKIAYKLGMDSELLIDMIFELEKENKIKYLSFGKGVIRIGEIEGGDIKEMSKEYPKSQMYFNSYTNKKGQKKYSINLDEETAKKFTENNQEIISAIVNGLKSELI